MHRLMEYGETIIMNSYSDAFFDTEKTFSSDDGFNLAFAITAYDDNPEPIDDPRYGRIIAKITSWGFEEDEQGVGMSEVKTRNCTKEELGIEGERDPESNFYPIHPNSERDVKSRYKKLKCFDEKVEILGDYNSK